MVGHLPADVRHPILLPRMHGDAMVAVVHTEVDAALGTPFSQAETEDPRSEVLPDVALNRFQAHIAQALEPHTPPPLRGPAPRPRSKHEHRLRLGETSNATTGLKYDEWPGYQGSPSMKFPGGAERTPRSLDFCGSNVASRLLHPKWTPVTCCHPRGGHVTEMEAGVHPHRHALMLLGTEGHLGVQMSCPCPMASSPWM